MTATDKNLEHDRENRRTLMSVLAAANTDDIVQAIGDASCDVEVADLRQPETGLVMLRGRIGGDGAPFNLGEATVTRAAVQLDTGEKGFSYVLGRDQRKARLAALCDALWQSPTYRAQVDRHVLSPLRDKQSKQLARTRAQTAATRVDFFTLVRGEDPA
ncbi:MAG TPA: phosphonate C-P lyase system protein PhnG [Pseudolabrys sp.]|jgi:alpha-D-ribose 1-methylphosphonate 5-triphosphate synthase subunit PhnG|nr:phosphonate C-P lyase system protein PhnG [Pseudolabrys sp.]